MQHYTFWANRRHKQGSAPKIAQSKSQAKPILQTTPQPFTASQSLTPPITKQRLNLCTHSVAHLVLPGTNAGCQRPQCRYTHVNSATHSNAVIKEWWKGISQSPTFMRTETKLKGKLALAIPKLQ
jgi:hypothetical protein